MYTMKYIALMVQKLQCLRILKMAVSLNHTRIVQLNVDMLLQMLSS